MTPPYYEKIPRPAQIAAETSLVLGRLATLSAAGPLSVPDLTPRETEVLVRASYGQTIEDAAYSMRLRIPELNEAKTSLGMKLHETESRKNLPTIAGTVNTAITRKILPVERLPGLETPSLEENDILILGMIAKGMKNADIAKFFGVHPGNQRRKINPRIFKAILANGRTHSVRRCYELGIFVVEN